MKTLTKTFGSILDPDSMDWIQQSPKPPITSQPPNSSVTVQIPQSPPNPLSRLFRAPPGGLTNPSDPVGHFTFNLNTSQCAPPLAHHPWLIPPGQLSSIQSQGTIQIPLYQYKNTKSSSQASIPCYELVVLRLRCL